MGTSATLELDPLQVEAIILGQRTGQLHLALRAMVDSTQPVHLNPLAGSIDDADSSALTVVRFGVTNPLGGK